jgi:hypothetical protein
MAVYGKKKIIMHRLEIINIFIKKYNFNSYLEIGVSVGDVLDHVEIKNKLGVDPDSVAYGYGGGDSPMIFKESDDFFKELNDEIKYDIIFIDGLHKREQVFRDIVNSIKHLTENGVIILHDCNPPTQDNATPEYNGGLWNGTVYLGYIDAIKTYNLNNYTIDCDWGCGVILPKNVNLNLERKYITDDWEYFDINRFDLLNLITVDEFLKNV